MNNVDISEQQFPLKNADLDLKRQMITMYGNANLLLRKFCKCSDNVKCYSYSESLIAHLKYLAMIVVLF